MKTRLCLLLVVCSLFATAPAWAQLDRATLSGTVKDPNGAVLTAVTVTVSSEATKLAQTTLTNQDGMYLVVNLAPGSYVVTATAKGFSPLAQTVVLEVGQRARVDFALAVGAVAESVTVEATSPSSTPRPPCLAASCAATRSPNLPLAIRNWDDLLFTLPGVQGDRYTEQTGTTNAGRTGGVSIHGNRSLQNNFLLDGVDNN